VIENEIITNPDTSAFALMLMALDLFLSLVLRNPNIDHKNPEAFSEGGEEEKNKAPQQKPERQEIQE
jgi:hypothetical protein